MGVRSAQEDERDHNSTQRDTEHQEIQWRLPVVPRRSIHHQQQFAVREQGKQDVQHVLRRQVGVVEDPRYDAGLGVQRSNAREVQGYLAVEGGLRLQDSEQHFSESHQGICSAMGQAVLQIGGERVSMGQGSSGDRHRPRYCPLCCLSASHTPFILKCQLLRSRP